MTDEEEPSAGQPILPYNVADFRRAWTFDLQDLLGSSSERLPTPVLGEQRV
jgi:hypothetical protein